MGFCGGCYQGGAYGGPEIATGCVGDVDIHVVFNLMFLGALCLSILRVDLILLWEVYREFPACFAFFFCVGRKYRRRAFSCNG